MATCPATHPTSTSYEPQLVPSDGSTLTAESLVSLRKPLQETSVQGKANVRIQLPTTMVVPEVGKVHGMGIMKARELLASPSKVCSIRKDW